MAYNKRHTSLTKVIEDVYRDSGYDSIDWEAAVEWVASLVRIIGITQAYTDRATNGVGENPNFIEVQNYRAVLPNDLVSITACRRVDVNDSGEVSKYAAMQETTDLFFTTPRTGGTLSTSFFDPEFRTHYIDENGDAQRITITQEPFTESYTSTFYYKIEGNIIFTNFEDGKLEMAYKALPADENGFPLIPEDEKFVRAVKSEIIWKLDKLRWRKNPSPQNKSILNDSAQERDWAVGAAITKSHIPTIDGMESIKKFWLRSIPKINEHGTNFSTMSLPEMRYTQNRRI